jgi:hypothetical protein
MQKQLGRLTRVAGALAIGALVTMAFAAEGNGPQQPWSKWRVHDMNRPMAPVVTPGTPSTPEQPGRPPSDAIVLFDGSNLNAWQTFKGERAPWKLQDGGMVTDKTDIRTRQEFGDVQLHLEWAEPTPAKGASQGRGNSGVFLMGVFEVRCSIRTRIRRMPTARAVPFTGNTRRRLTHVNHRANGRCMTSFSVIPDSRVANSWNRPM